MSSQVYKKDFEVPGEREDLFSSSKYEISKFFKLIPDKWKYAKTS
jgi:hypothetical protein